MMKDFAPFLWRNLLSDIGSFTSYNIQLSKDKYKLVKAKRNKKTGLYSGPFIFSYTENPFLDDYGFRTYLSGYLSNNKLHGKYVYFFIDGKEIISLLYLNFNEGYLSGYQYAINIPRHSLVIYEPRETNSGTKYYYDISSDPEKLSPLSIYDILFEPINFDFNGLNKNSFIPRKIDPTTLNKYDGVLNYSIKRFTDGFVDIFKDNDEPKHYPIEHNPNKNYGFNVYSDD